MIAFFIPHLLLIISAFIFFCCNQDVTLLSSGSYAIYGDNSFVAFLCLGIPAIIIYQLHTSFNFAPKKFLIFALITYAASFALYNQSIDTEAQLIINDSGIIIKGLGSIPWKEIKNIDTNIQEIHWIKRDIHENKYKYRLVIYLYSNSLWRPTIHSLYTENSYYQLIDENDTLRIILDIENLHIARPQLRNILLNTIIKNKFNIPVF